MQMNNLYRIIIKKLIWPILDMLIIVACLYFVFAFSIFGTSEFSVFLLLTLIAYIIFQGIYKLNRSTWNFFSTNDYVKIALTTFSVLIVSAVASLLFFEFDFDLVIQYFYGMSLSFSLIVLARFSFILLMEIVQRKILISQKNKENNTLIIGAGWTGNLIIQELKNTSKQFNPVCVVDDDPSKQNQNIQDVYIVGTTNDILDVVEKYKIRKIIFAIPSCPNDRRTEILKLCAQTKCIVKVIPRIKELVETDLFNQAQDIKIEDLLGREPVSLNNDEAKAYISDKICLVTGGGGSIGSELCRQIVLSKPKKLVILDIYENNAYDIQQELIMNYGKDLNLAVEIVSVADYDKCKILFEKYKPQIIFHAAAHKHVPLMETAPEQAIKNNVVGTLNFCKLSQEFEVEKFVLISTDKAVNPTNVMGASKRLCEMIVKSHSQSSTTTKFCAVRFGNVLGSNGSVIPLFKKQIKEGGPITLTHKDIIRYFMTIPEAVSLVLKTGALSRNGEIFVLDMGNPVKIYDLAINLITLSGLVPERDIKIEFIGLRPGEKLYEELLIAGEGMKSTVFEKIFICEPVFIDDNDFLPKLDKIIEFANKNDEILLLEQLKIIIPEFTHKIV